MAMERSTNIKPGDRFGSWTVLRVDHQLRGLSKVLSADVRCDCGKEQGAACWALLRGPDDRNACSTCRYRRNAEFLVWTAMIGRCGNPENSNYTNYGGRGISVCGRWRESFENFIADMGKRPSHDHSIDRINNDGNYEPSNCRWATWAEQSRNKRSNRHVTVGNRTMIVADWAAETGLSHTTITSRLRRGWSPERAVTPFQSRSQGDTP